MATVSAQGSFDIAKDTLCITDATFQTITNFMEPTEGLLNLEFPAGGFIIWDPVDDDVDIGGTGFTICIDLITASPTVSAAPSSLPSPSAEPFSEPSSASMQSQTVSSAPSLVPLVHPTMGPSQSSIPSVHPLVEPTLSVNPSMHKGAAPGVQVH